MATARDYFSPGSPYATAVSGDGHFSPSSEQVRALFPRDSSLSPSRKIAEGNLRVDGCGRVPVIRKPPAMAMSSQPTKPAWPNLEGCDSSKVTNLKKNSAATNTLEPANYAIEGPLRGSKNGSGSVCGGCKQSRNNITEMREEMARMKTELLDLKMMIKRTGMKVQS